VAAVSDLSSLTVPELAEKVERGILDVRGSFGVTAKAALSELVADAEALAEALEALHAEVEMAESVGICLPDRVPSLNAGQVLARYRGEK
jgi:hypothetical protein